MKKIIFSLLILSLVIFMSYVALAAPAPKVTICHATSSETNPWTRIVVSENAIGGHFDNNGSPKAGHEDDVLLQGDQPCPRVENPNPDPDPNPEPEEPTPEKPAEPTPPPVTATPPSEPSVTPLK